MVPQIIYLLIIFLGLGFALAKHGEPKTEEYNFWVSFLASLIILGLLFWGGFFDPML